MSRIGLVGGSAVRAWATASPRANGGSSDAGIARTSTAPDSPSGVNFSGTDLLALNAGVDEQTRVHNALSTAGDAIAVIGGLVESIRGTIRAAGSSDTAAEQARIDSAITTIDAIASSSRFGGKSLLTGGYSATGPAGAIAIPSFVPTSLGLTQTGDNATASLASLGTGGALDLSSGKTNDATRVVTAALGQIEQTQSQITGLVSSSGSSQAAPAPTQLLATTAGADPVESVYRIGSMMLDDPALASVAAANASPAAVLALLQP